MEALGINLSEGGMGLFAVAHLPVGSHVQVEFCPPQSTEAVRVEGTIRHRALYLYGIEFALESDGLQKTRVNQVSRRDSASC